MCFWRDQWIKEMVDGAIKVREEARCLKRGTWTGMGCVGFGESWLQEEQSLETTMPSTGAASVGNQGCRIFKSVLVKPWWKPNIAPWSSSPNKPSGEEKTTHDFFFLQRSLFLLKWWKMFWSILFLKKDNEPFFLLANKKEDAQCKWKWHLFKHFILKPLSKKD